MVFFIRYKNTHQLKHAVNMETEFVIKIRIKNNKNLLQFQAFSDISSNSRKNGFTENFREHNRKFIGQ